MLCGVDPLPAMLPTHTLAPEDPGPWAGLTLGTPADGTRGSRGGEGGGGDAGLPDAPAPSARVPWSHLPVGRIPFHQLPSESTPPRPGPAASCRTPSPLPSPQT